MVWALYRTKVMAVVWDSYSLPRGIALGTRTLEAALPTRYTSQVSLDASVEKSIGPSSYSVAGTVAPGHSIAWDAGKPEGDM